MPEDAGQPELFPSQSYGKKEVDQHLNRLVRSVFDPIVVFPGYEDFLPAKLKTSIRMERIGRIYNKESDEECGDIEAMAYLHTASMAVPFNEQWTQIYVNVAKSYMSSLNTTLDSMESRSLTEYERKMLVDLKRWIRKQQRRR